MTEKTETIEELRIDYSQSGLEMAHSNFVRVVSSDDGFLLIFGQIHPDRENEILCVKQIFMPPTVVGQFLNIMLSHVTKLEERTGRKITPDELNLIIEKEES